MLHYIYYPTGGYREFLYEQHDYLDANNMNQPAGGVRIKTINESSGDPSSIKSTTYTYSNGTSSSGQLYQNFSEWSEGWTTVNIQANSSKILFDIDGTHVSYSTVTETVTGHGSSVYSFTNNSDHPDEAPTQGVYNSYAWSGKTLSTTGPPHAPFTTHSWERGILLSRVDLNNAGTYIRKTAYNYDFTQPEIGRIAGLISTWASSPYQDGSVDYTTGLYYCFSKAYPLVNTTVTTYDAYTTPIVTPIPDKYNVVSTDYVYDLSTLMLKQTSRYSQTNASAGIVITKQTYPTDYSLPNGPWSAELTALSTMIQNHMTSFQLKSLFFTKLRCDQVGQCNL